MIWNILGISPTNDKKAITSAYRNRLMQVHPEEKPEEFKALRSAYEQALAQADSAAQPQTADESPLGRWSQELKAIYEDFRRRIRVDAWMPLLEDDLCRGLDTRHLAEEALLRFLMEKYYLPQSVWQALNDVFSFDSRREELYERYPREFIDRVVLPGIQSETSMPYDLFEPGISGEACDQLRRLYYQAGSVPVGERQQHLEKLRAIPERHPYCEALFHAWTLDSTPEASLAGLQTLAETHPTDPTLNMAVIDACPNDWALSERLADRVLEAHPDHFSYRSLKAQCLAQRGEYEQAKDILFELFHQTGGDQVRSGQLQELMKKWNTQLIAQYSAALADDPSDSTSARLLSWCYLQNNDPDQAERAAAYVDQSREKAFDYHNLMAKLRYAQKRAADALPHLEQIIALLRTAKEDPDHPDYGQVHRLPEFLQHTGTCWLHLGEMDRAMALYSEAMESAPDDPTILDYMGRMLHFRKDYAGAADIYRRLSRIRPRNYHGFLMLAMNLYELGRDREAFDAINEALELEGSDLTVYVTKLRILLRNGVWDQVRQMLDFLRNAGVGDVITVRWCEAMLTEQADKDHAKAMAQYQAIAERVKQGEDLPWEAELHYRIALLAARDLDLRKKEDRSTMMELLEKCLAVDPEHEDALDYKAWLLRRDKQIDEALEIYHSLEQRPVHSLNVELGLAQIYYDRMETDADLSLKYYRHLLRHKETADYHFFAATCLRYLHDPEGAMEHFAREQELAPDDVDGYNGMAYALEAMGEYDKALEQMDKAIDAIRGKEEKYSWVFNHKAQILRRQGKLREAYELLTTAAVTHGAESCHRKCFEACCQFGDWALAKKALDQWIKSTGSNEANAEASVKLALYQGKMMKATMAFASAVKYMGEYRQDELKMTVASLEGNPKRSLEVWSKRYMKEKPSTRTVGCLAQAQWENGQLQEARRTASLLLDMLDKQLAGFTVDEALYRTQRIRPLAILGRFEEARAELQKARSLPLCAGCVYGCCKDADVFEAELEEIAGNSALALELFRRGEKNWPDELDMAAGVARLTKKGTKTL